MPLAKLVSIVHRLPSASSPFAARGPQTVAAVDLGSNSFHMIVARVLNGQLHVLDRLQQMVRLAAGLDEKITSTRLRANARSSACRVSANGCAACHRAPCARSAPTPCGARVTPGNSWLRPSVR